MPPTGSKAYTWEYKDWVNWGLPQCCYPVTVQLMALPVYSYSTLLGLVVSVGDLTESTVSNTLHSIGSQFLIVDI